jgi:hypothetical protein
MDLKPSPSDPTLPGLPEKAKKPWGLKVRKPDFVIGDPADPYMCRWWIIPKNPWVNIYLHKIRRDDDDRALHDHPNPNVSILLTGSYIEVLPDFSKAPTPYVRIFDLPRIRKLRHRGQILFRRATASHRLELHVKDGTTQPVWTLFIMIGKPRKWGFHCAQGWIDSDVYTDPDNPGAVGRGCG